MFIGLAGLVVVVWLVCWLGFHLAGGLIHLLLILAVIFIVIHFLTGRRA